MINLKTPGLILEKNKFKAGSVKWKSPSNIALVKYWGKYGVQLPRNPSVSFTLENAYTETSVDYEWKESENTELSLTFFFEGQPNALFEDKIRRFLGSILNVFPFLNQLELTIKSHNSFPHSSGIASSASSMSALALCICSMESQLFDMDYDESAFFKKASYIARLGSGSACRSVFPKIALWGELESLENASNLFAIPFTDNIHHQFKTFHDAILIINKGEKSVSSRAGHALMEGNPYAGPRYKEAKKRLETLLSALKEGDIETFGKITESEALTLHALMMTSYPPYILMKPNTLLAIQKVQAFRTSNQIPLYFTLDAGPNLHLLFPDEYHKTIIPFIEQELSPLCENGKWIADRVGEGPKKLP